MIEQLFRRLLIALDDAERDLSAANVMWTRATPQFKQARAELRQKRADRVSRLLGHCAAVLLVRQANVRATIGDTNGQTQSLNRAGECRRAARVFRC